MYLLSEWVSEWVSVIMDKILTLRGSVYMYVCVRARVCACDEQPNKLD